MKIIIFGSSGDLAKRKLFPALSKINLDNVEIIGYARTKYDVEFSEILQEVGSYSPEFLSKVTYIRGSYDDLSNLKDIVDSETVFYFSVPPSVYPSLLREVSNLEYRAIAIEKPYGNNKSSFEEMKEFPLDKAIFIDHYLLKPLVVAMPKLIKESKKLQELMNNKCIANVEIVSKEVIGGEGRHYFDKSGIVRDIIQNHMSELLGVVASDVTGTSKSIEGLARMKFFSECSIDVKNCIYGQYESYVKELHKDSNTETFAVIPMYINSLRWSKVPFIIIAGKGMNEKRTEIIFEFKREAFVKCVELISLKEEYRIVRVDEIIGIRLIFSVHPRCEIFLEIRTGDEKLEYVIYERRITDDIMQTHYGNYQGYEIIFDNLIKNIDFNSVGSSEAEHLWKIFDPILLSEEERRLFYYPKGIDMPTEAENIIKIIKNC